MFVVSGAFMRQVDIVQKDRWSLGPLELVTLPFVDTADHLEGMIQTDTWNGTLRACTARPGDAVRFFEGRWPALSRSKNPNLVMVPRIGNYTELHAMLASLVPAAQLAARGLQKRRANFHLLPWISEEDSPGPDAYAVAAEQAFSDYIWPRLVGRIGIRRIDFSPGSSLRLLAGDTAFWMNRVYRVAAARADSFSECSEQDEGWEPLDVIQSKLRSAHPDVDWSNFEVRRPLKGGELWLLEDQDECDAVIDEAIDGGGVMDSLTPILEVLLSNRAHDDFSDRYSWVKEDFERAFYHKRSKWKVSVVETIDDATAWHVAEPEGYDRVLFRDLLSFCNIEEQHLIVALRHGRTVSEIAQANGHRSHASMSRKIKQLRRRLRRFLS